MSNLTLEPALLAVTATDQRGVLVIAACMGLVFAITSLLIRAYVRVECNAAFAKDDLVSCLSMAAAIIQTSVVFVAVSRGYGVTEADLSPAALDDAAHDLFVSDLFYIIGMWLTKCAIALLLMRISRDPAHTRNAKILLVVSTVYLVIALLVMAIRCDVARPWALAGTASCPESTFARWSAVTTLDVLTEVALFVGSLELVRGLQLPWSKKAVVVVAYGLRLPVIVLAAIRLYYLHIALDSDDPSLHGILASVCTQIELGYAVAAVTMPCLRPFMTALNTHYGGGPSAILVSHSFATAQRSRDQSGNNSAPQNSKSRASTESEARFLESKGVSLNPLPSLSLSGSVRRREDKDRGGDVRSASPYSTASGLHETRVGEGV